MGERRFEHGEEYGEGDMYIWDNVSHKEIWTYDDLNEVCDLLNELLEDKEYFERKKEYFLGKWSIAHAGNIQLRQENKELKKENEQLKKRLYLYEISEDEVYKYLGTHPMPTRTNEKTITPLDMRHKRC